MKTASSTFSSPLLRRKSLALVVSVLAAAVCWTAWAITNGEPDGPGHPQVAAVIINDPVNGPTIRCTGTLVHPRALLVAAHCPFLFEAEIAAGQYALEDVFVSFDSGSALDPATWHAVKDLIAHPEFGFPPIKLNDWPDVGLIILEQAMDGLPLAVLPSAGLLDELRATRQLRTGKNATQFLVVGYGASLAFPPPASVAPDGIRRAASAEYVGLFQELLQLHQNPASAAGGIGGGDSGGPTFWMDSAGQEILVAVTSLGAGYSLTSLGFAARVDTPRALAFLQAELAALDEE